MNHIKFIFQRNIFDGYDVVDSFGNELFINLPNNDGKLFLDFLNSYRIGCTDLASYNKFRKSISENFKAYKKEHYAKSN